MMICHADLKFTCKHICNPKQTPLINQTSTFIIYHAQLFTSSCTLNLLNALLSADHQIDIYIDPQQLGCDIFFCHSFCPLPQIHFWFTTELPTTCACNTTLPMMCGMYQSHQALGHFLIK